VVIAPDDAKFWAVTTDNTTSATGPTEVWITKNGGSSWERTGIGNVGILALGETIRTLDISIDYGGRRDLAVGTVTGTGAGKIFVLKSSGFGGWTDQGISALLAIGTTADFYAVKFSPTYSGDSGLAFVMVTAAAVGGENCFYNIALRDIDANTTLQFAFPSAGIAVKDQTWAAGSTPELTELNGAVLELPSDFSATAVSLRRAYISLDTWGTKTGFDGIFRIDDNTVYTLMDTHLDATKSIYSIAYFGTYASGKLLAGERKGYSCTATVPTWFTDSPTTCPIPCWYPALKPTTGAADGTCTVSAAKDGNGSAIVAWNPSGTLAYVVTGDQPVTHAAHWFSPWLVAPTANREGAFAISRNKGETWNQLGMINTTLDWLNDVAAAPDCSTVYIASVNLSGIAPECTSFDSVWRSTTNPAVAAPLPPMPIGTYWERVFTHVTAVDCADNQTDEPILRLPPYCDDLPDGQLIAWAAVDTRAQAWSPDFGDYWAMITPRHPIGDFAFESSKVMYDLEFDGGLVQKLPFTGTAWSTLIPDVDISSVGHTIAAYPEGNVLVGSNTTASGSFAAAVSTNFNTDTPSFDFLWMLSGGATADQGDVHAAFDTNFKNNGLVYIADEAMVAPAAGHLLDSVGSVYRNKVPGAIRWIENDMMEPTNGAVGTFNQSTCPVDYQKAGLYGIVNAFTGANGQQALYVASDTDNITGFANSVVFRTLWPQDGMPKPGIIWDALMTYTPSNQTGVSFTLEPSSLKECGSCSLDTNTTLYAIDDEAGGTYLAVPGYDPHDRQGQLWTYTDCLAKKGPALITEDKALIGCDPVSGRAQEVNHSERSPGGNGKKNCHANGQMESAHKTGNRNGSSEPGRIPVRRYRRSCVV
jgi:hypothetical protein